MKIKVLIGLLAALSMTAHAQINIVYQGTGGFLKNNDSDGIVEFGGFSYVQLLWTPDSSPAGSFLGGVPLGSEVVLQSFWVDSTSPYGEFAGSYNNQAAGSFQPGNIFMRVFDSVNASDTSLITAGHFYYWSPLEALESKVSPEFQFLDANRNQSSFGIGDPVGPGFTDDVNFNIVVPEPSVMALMGLGGLILAIRRRRMTA
jgi:hypothetical protein